MDCFQLSNQPLALGPSDQSPSVAASGTVGGGELGPRWQGSGRVGVRRDGRTHAWSTEEEPAEKQELVSAASKGQQGVDAPCKPGRCVDGLLSTALGRPRVKEQSWMQTFECESGLLPGLGSDLCA